MNLIVCSLLFFYFAGILGIKVELDQEASTKRYLMFSGINKVKNPKDITDTVLLGLARDAILSMNAQWPAVRASEDAKESAAVAAAKAALAIHKATAGKDKAKEDAPPQYGKAAIPTPPNAMTAIFDGESVQFSSSVRRITKHAPQTVLQTISGKNFEDSFVIEGIKSCQPEYNEGGISTHKNEASCGEIMGLHIWGLRHPGKKPNDLTGSIVTVQILNGESDAKSGGRKNKAKGNAKEASGTDVSVAILPPCSIFNPAAPKGQPDPKAAAPGTAGTGGQSSLTRTHGCRDVLGKGFKNLHVVPDDTKLVDKTPDVVFSGYEMKSIFKRAMFWRSFRG